MQKILVINSTIPATQRTTSLLFRPFSKKIWLTLALAAALTLLGETESIDLLLHLLAAWLEESFTSLHLTAKLPTLDDTLKWLPLHTTLLISYLLAATILGSAIYLLYRWANCRAQFMMLDFAQHDPVLLKQSWIAHRRLAWSLLKLRIWWDLILFNAFLLLAIAAALLALPDWKPLLSGNPCTFSAWSTSAILLTITLASLLSAAIWVVGSMLHYMVVPLMHLRDLDAWPAFKLTWQKLFRPHLKPCLAYFLMMILANSALRLLAIAGFILLTICTCGTGFIIALIPLLGALTLYPIALAALPVILWQRAYMLNFINQFPTEFTLQRV